MTTQSAQCCERCGTLPDRLYELEYNGDDEYGDPKVFKAKVCWSCDFDVMNGGDYEEEMSDIFQRRKEEAYAYDPINNKRPW